MTQSITVLVAQRVSTVMDADTILVLDEGKLVGKGTHDELLKTNETYQEIVHSQLRERRIYMSKENTKPSRGPMGGGHGPGRNIGVKGENLRIFGEQLDDYLGICPNV